MLTHCAWFPGGPSGLGGGFGGSLDEDKQMRGPAKSSLPTPQLKIKPKIVVFSSREYVLNSSGVGGGKR